MSPCKRVKLNDLHIHLLAALSNGDGSPIFVPWSGSGGCDKLIKDIVGNVLANRIKGVRLVLQNRAERVGSMADDMTLLLYDVVHGGITLFPCALPAGLVAMSTGFGPWTSTASHPFSLPTASFTEQLGDIAIHEALVERDVSQLITVLDRVSLYTAGMSVDIDGQDGRPGRTIQFKCPDSLCPLSMGAFLRAAYRLHNVSDARILVGVNTSEPHVIIGIHLTDVIKQGIIDAAFHHFNAMFPPLPNQSVALTFHPVAVPDVDAALRDPAHFPLLVSKRFVSAKDAMRCLKDLLGKAHIFESQDGAFVMVTLKQYSPHWTAVDENDIARAALLSRSIIEIRVRARHVGAQFSCPLEADKYADLAETNSASCQTYKKNMKKSSDKRHTRVFAYDVHGAPRLLDAFSVYLRARPLTSFAVSVKLALQSDSNVRLFFPTSGREAMACETMRRLLGARFDPDYVVEDVDVLIEYCRRPRIAVVDVDAQDRLVAFLRTERPSPAGTSIVLLLPPTRLVGSRATVAALLSEIAAFEDVVLTEVFVMIISSMAAKMGHGAVSAAESEAGVDCATLHVARPTAPMSSPVPQIAIGTAGQ